jgi:pyruvate/2-oxoglutarate dehydrogenase complex dihydrolipoamide dehydrogenase (E3) component/uncharacterized membrane protein YdjX (TVP38/TMEM64 family)
VAERPIAGSGATRSSRESFGRIATAVVVIGLLIAAVKFIPVERYLLDFVAWIQRAGFAGLVAYVGAYIAACVLFIPGSILTLGAGFAYGVMIGVPVVWIGASIGATLAFILGRTLMRGWVASKVAGNPSFAAIDRAVGQQGLKIVILTRLSPIFPFNLLNYAFGLTQVSLRDYVIGTVAGILPGTVMFVYLGSLITSLTQLAAGRTSGGAAQQIFYFAGLAATVIVTIYVTRVARRALADATGMHGDAAAVAKTPLPNDADKPLVLPDDEHNRTLIKHGHPVNYVNPAPSGRYNLVVVGAGTAGLVSAAGGAGLGAKVALIERHLMGGDCLNVGCVPSKGIISAARVASTARGAAMFGVRTVGVEVDFPAVMERMRRLRAQISHTDSVARYADLGVDVYLGDAHFTGPDTIEVDGRTLRFSRAVITTGARAAAPPIPGLEEVGYLTNETVFWLTELPRRMVVIGAGPIGCEMAQTFRRFGAEVTQFEEGPHVLLREDADAAAIVEARIRAEGVRLIPNARITRVARRGGEIIVEYTAGGAAQSVSCDQILVGVGRAPNVEGLGLEAAGVAYDRSGVTVDDRLRTTNHRIYAAGDICSKYKFTHMADSLARIVLANALFGGRRKASALHVPWCTYTSPEVAHVGMYEADAINAGIEVNTITIPLREVDRAVLEGEDAGFVRVHLRKGSDRILGATIVAEHAGEMISELTLAMEAGVGLGRIASVVHPYPTQAEAIRKAGDAYNRTRLTPAVRKLFDLWLRWHR